MLPGVFGQLLQAKIVNYLKFQVQVTAQRPVLLAEGFVFHNARIVNLLIMITNDTTKPAERRRPKLILQISCGRAAVSILIHYYLEELAGRCRKDRN